MSKAFTTTDIAIAIQKENGFTLKRSQEIVETILKIIKNTLGSGEGVLISGFGKFCVKQKAERMGRNPATGNEMLLPPRKVVTFKCSGKLKEKINRS